MHPKIEVRVDSKRGCGWRKPGGLYLVGDGPAFPCGRLPIPLNTCPTCGHGFKPSRGWTWVDAPAICAAVPCKAAECSVHCPLGRPFGRVGLLWVGEVYYKSPADFAGEADRLGISRRIATVPKAFLVGRTWIWLAHRGAIRQPCPWCPAPGRLDCCSCYGEGTVKTPGVFRAFKPERIEYVVIGSETDAEIDDLISRGITPVRVVRDEATQSSFLEPPEN
jgi:hypothetical protein